MPNDEQPQPLPDNSDTGGNEPEFPGVGETRKQSIPERTPDYGEVRHSYDQPVSVRPDERDEIIVDTGSGDTIETGDVEQGGGD